MQSVVERLRVKPASSRRLAETKTLNSLVYLKSLGGDEIRANTVKMYGGEYLRRFSQTMNSQTI